MKTMTRLWALCLALLMAFSACAMAEEAPEENPVLFTVGERAYTLTEVNDTILNLYANSYLDSMADYDTAIEYLVQMEMIELKIKELGLDQYTEEEEKAFRAEAQATWDEAIASYVQYFLTEDTEEARAQAVQDAEAYYATYGVSIDTLIKDIKWNDGLEMLQQQSVTVTEEEIKSAFDSYAQQDKEMFGDDILLYEYYQYNGYEMLYTPEGYRGISHILIEVNEELMDAYNTAKAALEEQQTVVESETAEGEAAEEKAPVTQADVDAARDAIFASRQKEIDDIYARLEKGETFESLVELYGTDPGMQDAKTLAEGYPVHKDSVIYDAAFTAESFSDKMTKVGDVSDPFISSFGIHILKYQRDVPSGFAEMTDEIHDILKSNLMNTKFAEQLKVWAQDKVVYNQEAIDAAKAEAAAAEALEMAEAADEGIEIVPVPEDEQGAEEAPALE